MARALIVYRELARMVPDDPSVGQDDARWMLSGHCAFGFRWSGAPFDWVMQLKHFIVIGMFQKHANALTASHD
jgi:hypothetical protein